MSDQNNKVYVVDKEKIDKLTQLLADSFKMCQEICTINNHLIELIRKSLVSEMDNLNYTILPSCEKPYNFIDLHNKVIQ